jgi:UDP-3-O-[3-hydroxymyristoyl] glucosamine N-acyltransferase
MITSDERINILFKDGSVKDISQIDNALIHQQLSGPVKKYYICYYRCWFTIEEITSNLQLITSNMNFTASQIALLINGKIEGDANASVNSFGKIEEAKPGQLAFLANPKYEDHLYSTQASVIIVNESLQLKQDVGATLIRVP